MGLLKHVALLSRSFPGSKLKQTVIKGLRISNSQLIKGYFSNFELKVFEGQEKHQGTGHQSDGQSKFYRRLRRPFVVDNVEGQEDIGSGPTLKISPLPIKQ